MITGAKRIYLCNAINNLNTELNGVVIDTVSLSPHSKDYTTLSFNVDQYIIVNGEKILSNGYDNLKVNMYLLLEGIGYFRMEPPQISNDGVKEQKSITAYSCEKEFEDKDIVSFKVNTGEDGSLERLNKDNLDELGIAKEYVTFYRSNDSGKTDYSMIHYFLEKMPGWSVRDEDIDKSLWYKKATFDEDNTNLYSLLTSVVAPKFECIITFDILHRRIGAISKDHFEAKTVKINKPDGTTETVVYNNDFDSSVFIGFRNLANLINVSTDEDSVFTQFTCSGNDDLDFKDVNFGQTTILDLSYFMCEPYMRQTTVNKLNKWKNWCDENRDVYISLSKQWANLNDKNHQLQDRVPSDMDYWKQWSDMDSELLDKNLKYYQTLLESLQQSVDERLDSEKFTGSGDDRTYNPIKNEDGSVNHNYYLELLKQGKGDYGGYYTYFEVITYVIPNIQIAIENKGKVESKQKDYVKTYETDWSLYGITELENKKKTYEDIVTTLGEYTLPFDEMETDKKESEYTKKYSEYWSSKKNLETLIPVLEQLKQEQTELESQITEINKKREELAHQYLFSYKNDSGETVYNWDLTEKEYILITTLIRNTDYVNSNIMTTSVDTTLTTIDREKELYDDSVDKISEVSQPQYTFTVDMDNLLHIPEFESWVGDIELYKFIRLGIRDNYSVKLRIVGIRYNPCEITPDLTLEFSNMITSSSGRSDLTDILSSENNRGSKNSINIGSNKDYDVSFVTTFLDTIMKTNQLRDYVSSTVDGMNIPDNVILDKSEIKDLFMSYTNLGLIELSKISYTQKDLEEFYQQYGLLDSIIDSKQQNVTASLSSINNSILAIKKVVDTENSTLNKEVSLYDYEVDEDGNVIYLDKKDGEKIISIPKSSKNKDLASISERVNDMRVTISNQQLEINELKQQISDLKEIINGSKE